MEFLDRVPLLPSKPLCNVETTLASRALRKTCAPKSQCFVHRVVHHKRPRCNKNSFLIGEQWTESHRYAVYRKLFFFCHRTRIRTRGKVNNDNRKYRVILYKLCCANDSCCIISKKSVQLVFMVLWKFMHYLYISFYSANIFTSLRNIKCNMQAIFGKKIACITVMYYLISVDIDSV